MITRRQSLALGGAALLARPALIGTAAAQTKKIDHLPATQIWSVYDVGSTGYVEASAIADAMGKAYGTRVRLQPSGTSIGRVLPLKQRRASHAWLANELYFAVEGLYEYADPQWGPQDFRVLCGRKNAFSVVATKESGITKPEDLKGKRLAYVPANTSVNLKVEPILAFAGLTLNDVEVVQFPSYGASLRALIEGRADAAGAAPAAAVLRELEASPRGISWVQLDPSNAKGWEAARKAVPFVDPFAETVGAGMSEQNPVNVMGYRYPMVTVNADADTDEVFAMMQALDQSYDLYKDVSGIMTRWKMKEAGTPPMDAAFHEGAIRYLKKVGLWSDTHQQWQDKTLKRHQALQAAWKEFMGGPGGKESGEALEKAWMPVRAKALAAL